MKNLLTFLLLTLLFACGGKQTTEEIAVVEEPKNILENLTFSIDTLVVDPGEEIINLKHLGANYVSLSPSKDQFCFFDRSRPTLHEIDLNTLKLTNNYPFEEEGPDGIGRFVYLFKRLSDGNFWVQDLLGSTSVFSKTGKKIRAIEFNKEELLQDFPLGLNLTYELQVDLGRRKFYSLPLMFKVEKKHFAVMNSSGQTEKIVELPEFDKIEKFKVEYNSGRDGGDGRGELVRLEQPNDLVLISSTVGNGIYIYNPELDSLWYQEFPHELTPLEKDVKVKNVVHSPLELEAEREKFHTQIDYWGFYWDEHTQRYYRFASIGLSRASTDSPKKYNHYLFAYDKELTLKGEAKLEGLEKIPAAGFFKDGKLYSYVNVEDELGFAVFTFDF
ncbi:DUF4221 domain-containing protein [Algoriphagus sp. AGSA1]|uniref:DUF4221 family protein n=1 Tax=Algoriphagus sp. AGSA1 TaxID=2907213 RepID=UPI001F44694C|nr:DUF4221 family protein [Algoriphagus sp. AGSA1]MCE7055937.1 DUF4221 domain-containing protein [Algoriphagus sp. AGSA1]